MKLHVDRDHLADQMNSLGLSERQVVARTGIPQVAFRRMRIDGVVDRHIKIGVLSDIADLLGTTIGAVLAAPATAEPTATQSATAADDAVTLIPILITVGRYVSLAHVARVMDWTYSRALKALDVTPKCLENTGFRLIRTDTEVAIQAVARDIESTSAVGKLQTKTAGLKANQATMLRRIVEGENVTQRQMSSQDKLSVGALKNMGCIELDEKAQYRLSESIRSALPDLV